MSDNTKPGIKTRRADLDAGLVAELHQIALTDALNDFPKRPVKKQRKGLRLALRKLCYRILDRT